MAVHGVLTIRHSVKVRLGTRVEYFIHTLREHVLDISSGSLSC